MNRKLEWVFSKCVAMLLAASVAAPCALSQVALARSDSSEALAETAGTQSSPQVAAASSSESTFDRSYPSLAAGLGAAFGAVKALATLPIAVGRAARFALLDAPLDTSAALLYNLGPESYRGNFADGARQFQQWSRPLLHPGDALGNAASRFGDAVANAPTNFGAGEQVGELMMNGYLPARAAAGAAARYFGGASAAAETAAAQGPAALEASTSARGAAAIDGAASSGEAAAAESRIGGGAFDALHDGATAADYERLAAQQLAARRAGPFDALHDATPAEYELAVQRQLAARRAGRAPAEFTEPEALSAETPSAARVLEGDPNVPQSNFELLTNPASEVGSSPAFIGTAEELGAYEFGQ